jgi:hypothetical protein
MKAKRTSLVSTPSWSDTDWAWQPLAAVLLLATIAAVSCGSGADDCISLPSSCTPSLTTDFNNIYSGVISQRCGTTSTEMSCHSAAANQGGLILSDPNSAYDALMGAGASHPRVIPGDPECSPLMARLQSDDPKQRMPKGQDKLPEGVRCAIQMWIRNGASR